VGLLFNTIRRLVLDGRYAVGQHASERLEERSILEWQIVDGMATGRLIVERPSDQPNPAVETAVTLADGTEVKAIWSYVISGDFAKLVTVHFFDE
jgi:hypothetical protein